MKNRNSVQIYEFIGAIMAVALMILGARSMANSVKIHSTPANVTVLPGLTPNSEPKPSGGELVINHKIYHLDCDADGKVINATIDLEISGGVPPYYLEFDPGELIISDIDKSSTVRFVLEGGKNLTVKVKSNAPDGKPMDTLDIHAPSYSDECEDPPPTDTATPTPTDTATSTPTNTRIPARTPTKTKSPPDDLGSTETGPPVTPTPTGMPTATLTGSRTPTVVPTSTPTSVPISTPTTAPTSTPTTGPGKPSECEDGEDNDKDGSIDLLDSDCSGVNDNHEGK